MVRGLRAVKHRVPAIADLAQAGLLMAYAVDLADQYRRAAGFVDTILRGAKPGDLPIEQPTVFRLVNNAGARIIHDACHRRGAGGAGARSQRGASRV